MTVEIDAHAGPIETSRHLLDMGRLAGPMITGHDHPPIFREAGQDGERGRPIEPVVGIEIRDMEVRLRISRHFHVAVDPEYLPNGYLHIRQPGHFLARRGHCSSVIPVESAGPGSGAHRAANLAESMHAANPAVRISKSL